MSGILYMVATPIGNLEDITYRAIRILAEASSIYAEDTRVSVKLLARYSLKVPLHSFREAAPRALVERTISKITAELAEGNDLAFVSDAGTPGISDPGQYLVQRVLEAGFNVVPIPGPSSHSTLLSIAGLPLYRTLSIGFLPKKKGHQTLLERLRQALVSEAADSILLLESPERVVALLKEIAQWELPLEVVLGRELTKRFEEVIRGSVNDVLNVLSSKPTIKGEITLLLYYRP